jgi:hypothetical protein
MHAARRLRGRTAEGRRREPPCRCPVEPRQACWCEFRAAPEVPARHEIGYERTPVTALRTNLVYPRRFISTIQARAIRSGPQPVGRLAGKPVARHRGNHDVERVGCGPAMGHGIRQRIDDLELLSDRAGPSVRDDERQRISDVSTERE